MPEQQEGKDVRKELSERRYGETQKHLIQLNPVDIVVLLRDGLEMLVVGTLAGGAAYVIGYALNLLLVVYRHPEPDSSVYTEPVLLTTWSRSLTQA